MTRAITLIPSTGECEDLTYNERVSRDRGLHVLLQDCSTENIPSRRRFLLSAYREIVSRYISFGKIEHPLPLAAHLLGVLEETSKSVECWVGDYESLGFYVLFQDGDTCYVLANRKGKIRIRFSGGFAELDPDTQPEVTRLPVESAEFQKELFDNHFQDFVELYKIRIPQGGSLDVVMGGGGEESAAALYALEQTGAAGNSDQNAEVPIDSISRKILFVRTASSAPARHDAAGYMQRRAFPASGNRKGAILFTVAATVVFIFLGAIWVSDKLSGGGPAANDARLEPPQTVPGAGETSIAAGDLSGEDPIEPDKTEMAASPGEDPGAPAESTRVNFGVVWDNTYSEAITSSPLIAGKNVIFGGRDGRLYALSKNNGRAVWRHQAASGIGASPVLAGDRVIAADYLGNVFAVGLVEGNKLWNRKLPQKVVSSPVMAGGEVLVGCLDGGAYALSAETGRILWKVKTGARVRGTAARGDGLYFIPSYDGKLYAVSQGTGTRKWTYQLGGKVSSSPDAANGQVVIGGADGGIYALDSGSGELRWKFETAGAVKSFIRIYDQRVYAGSSDRALYCLEANTGELVWKYETRGVIFSRPVVDGRHVIFASYDGNVYCLDSKTGEELDRFGSNGSVFSSPAVEDETIYFGNNKGKFYSLTLRSKGTS